MAILHPAPGTESSYAQQGAPEWFFDTGLSCAVHAAAETTSKLPVTFFAPPADQQQSVALLLRPHVLAVSASE